MRNQRMDLFQCVAIYSVVPLHIKTGLLDGQTAALTRFAAPFFLLGAWAHFGEERHTSSLGGTWSAVWPQYRSLRSCPSGSRC